MLAECVLSPEARDMRATVTLFLGCEPGQHLDQRQGSNKGKVLPCSRGRSTRLHTRCFAQTHLQQTKSGRRTPARLHYVSPFVPVTAPMRVLSDTNPSPRPLRTLYTNRLANRLGLFTDNVDRSANSGGVGRGSPKKPSQPHLPLGQGLGHLKHPVEGLGRRWVGPNAISKIAGLPT